MPTKQEIKEWLKKTKKSREWLADQCGVRRITVNDWFTARGKIPAAKMFIIQSLMNEIKTPDELRHGDVIETPGTGVKAIAVMYSTEEWDQLLMAAEKTGLAPDELIRRASLGMYDDD